MIRLLFYYDITLVLHPLSNLKHYVIYRCPHYKYSLIEILNMTQSILKITFEQHTTTVYICAQCLTKKGWCELACFDKREFPETPIQDKDIIFSCPYKNCDSNFIIFKYNNKVSFSAISDSRKKLFSYWRHFFLSFPDSNNHTLW